MSFLRHIITNGDSGMNQTFFWKTAVIYGMTAHTVELGIENDFILMVLMRVTNNDF
jgi:hypothetical protein